MMSNKVKGFTIAETMLALLITLMCFGILQNTLGIIKKSERLKDPVNEVAYSYVQLDRFLKKEDHIEIYPDSSNPKKIVLRKLVSKKENGEPVFENYVIEGYKNMIRLRGIEGGHVPLLLNVKTCEFAYDDDEFTIQVDEEKGGRSELVFKVDKPLKINKKKIEKDNKTQKTNNKSEAKKSTSKRIT